MFNVHPSSRMRKCYQASTLLLQHIATVVTNVTASTRTTVTPQQHPQTHPITNTYIKTYGHVMRSDVASSLSQRPSRDATKQLRSLEQRATPRLQETHSHSQHTRPICYQVPIIIVIVYHRIARRSNCALSNDKRHVLPQLLL